MSSTFTSILSGSRVVEEIETHHYVIVCLGQSSPVDSTLPPRQFIEHIKAFGRCMTAAQSKHLEVWHLNNHQYWPIYGTEETRPTYGLHCTEPLSPKDIEDEYNKVGCMVTNLYMLWRKHEAQYRRAIAERKLAGASYDHLLPKVDELVRKMDCIDEFVEDFDSDLIREIFDARFRQHTKLEFMPQKMHLGFSTVNRYLREVRVELGAAILRTWSSEEITNLFREYELERRNFTKTSGICS